MPVCQLETVITFEELREWADFYALENEEYEKAAAKARAKSGR